MRGTLWLGAALALLAGGPARADEKKAAGVRVVKDVAYYEGKDADKVRHKLDLYLPRGAKDFPVFVFIHGGAWRAGNKNGFAKQGHTFARHGIAFVAVNYRLSPKIKHPAHVEDVARAFAWVHKNIAKYGGNPDQLFVGGHSAGGHLAALLGTDEQYLKAHKLSLGDVRGVVPISGVFRIAAGTKFAEECFGDKQVCKKASPIEFCKEKHPPFLVFYADKELGGLGKQAEEFGKALKKNKCDVEVRVIKDRNHGSIMTRVADADDPVTRGIFAFIAKHTGGNVSGKE
jgi:acetyl esterase/lipase